MSILLKATYRFNAISIYIPKAFFSSNRKNNARFHKESQRTLVSQKQLGKRISGEHC
jgi:hypothetical protein